MKKKIKPVKPRRRYRLVWPWKKRPLKKMKTHRRHLRPQILWGAIGIVSLCILAMTPRFLETNALRKLGYAKKTIKAIRENKLQKELLQGSYYSYYLEASIQDGSVNRDYLPYYAALKEKDAKLDAEDFLLISRLLDRGYEMDQVQNLIGHLHYEELTPLLVFDYQPIEQNYIDDVCKHRDTNSSSHFVLDRSYYTPYKNALPVPVRDQTMLVNKTYCLDSSYVPENLVTLSNWYATANRQLSQEAADALAAFGDGGRAVGVTFFAVSAYRPYESQEKVYNSLVASQGQEKADQSGARPGFSEHQSGLAVDLAASNEDDIPEFVNTNAYKWASSNCADFGWILRYPENKESITGYEFEPWHYRYVGTELAKAVYDSKMTFDEFWMLYLQPWQNADHVPKSDILEHVRYTVNASAPKETPAVK